MTGLIVASVNVNGIRAAVRRGMGPWLTARTPDVLCLQEIASPGLAARAVKAEIDRAPAYAQRWSDHAPVVVTFDR